MNNPSNQATSERDEHFLRRSFDVARRAMTHGNHPFGAMLVDAGGKVLLEAENGYMPAHDGTAHAERLLATMACTTIAPNILRDATLYSSAEPCAMCAGAISHARLRRLYYAASDPKGGAVDNGPRFFRQPTCHHAPEVYGGLRESEAAAMLTAFFAARR